MHHHTATRTRYITEVHAVCRSSSCLSTPRERSRSEQAAESECSDIRGNMPLLRPSTLATPSTKPREDESDDSDEEERVSDTYDRRPEQSDADFLVADASRGL
jgi:hypothetical protein